MPYDAENGGDVGSMKDKLKATYSSVSDTATRQAIHIFNSVMKEHSDEGRAWAGVYSKMNERLTKKKAQEKTAGFFSWQCLGCGRSLLSSSAVDRNNDFGWMTDVVAVYQDGVTILGEYDGYGRIDGRDGETEIVDDMWGKDGPSLWHEACWKKKGRPSWKGPSPSARDQGFFLDESEYQGAQPGRRASTGETMPFPPEMLEALDRVATKHPKHAEALRAVAKSAGVPAGAKELLAAHKLVKMAGEALDKAGRLKLPSHTLDGEVNHAAEVVWNLENQVQEGLNIMRTASGWIPGGLRDDDKIWETGEVDNSPFIKFDEGSQVPPARDNDGNQLNEQGLPVDSIPRAKGAGQFDWDDDRIIDYFDENPDATLRDLARMTGRTVAQLKKLLMGGRRAGTVDDAWNRLGRVVQS